MKEQAQMWKEFMKEWIPAHQEVQEDGEVRFLKPKFFDFMQWVTNKIEN